MNNIDKIKSFDELSYTWDLSYGGHWVRGEERIGQYRFEARRMLKEEFEEKLKFLHDFRCDALPFGEYPDYVLLEFLNKYFDKQVKECYS